jgi:hypothetical protein
MTETGVFDYQTEIKRFMREDANNTRKILAVLREYFEISDPDRHGLDTLINAAILMEMRNDRNKN